MHIAPGKTYGWKPDGNPKTSEDYGHTMSAIEWRDIGDCPTEQEVLAAWPAILADMENTAAKEQDIHDKIDIIRDPIERDKLSLEDKVEYLLEVVAGMVGG